MNSLIIITDIIEKLILFSLLGLSIWSVSIMVDRKRVFAKEFSHSTDEIKKLLLNKDFTKLKSLCAEDSGYIKGSINQALKVSSLDGVERAVSSFTKGERRRLEKGLTVLATLGANAPFIGLFGTVLGIIRSFAYLGSQSGSAAVMSGVSQALYATAVGLFVAIPAVVAFNIFSKKLKDLNSEVESLRDLYISQLKG